MKVNLALFYELGSEQRGKRFFFKKKKNYASQSAVGIFREPTLPISPSFFSHYVVLCTLVPTSDGEAYAD